MVQIQIRKTETIGNNHYQNVLATWTQFQTLHKQQNYHIQSNIETNLDLRNTTPRYGFQHRTPRMLPIGSFTYDVDALWFMLNTVIQSDLEPPTGTENIRRYTSQYSAAKRHTSELSGANRQQAIAKELPKFFTDQNLVQLSNLWLWSLRVRLSHSSKPQEA
jgi:hypothetical protein